MDLVEWDGIAREWPSVAAGRGVGGAPTESLLAHTPVTTTAKSSLLAVSLELCRCLHRQVIARVCVAWMRRNIGSQFVEYARASVDMMACIASRAIATFGASAKSGEHQTK